MQHGFCFYTCGIQFNRKKNVAHRIYSYVGMYLTILQRLYDVYQLHFQRPILQLNILFALPVPRHLCFQAFVPSQKERYCRLFLEVTTKAPLRHCVCIVYSLSVSLLVIWPDTILLFKFIFRNTLGNQFDSWRDLIPRPHHSRCAYESPTISLCQPATPSKELQRHSHMLYWALT